MIPRFILLQGPVAAPNVWEARRMAAALPAPLGKDVVSLAWLYMGARLGGSDPTSAPFRAPHHTASCAALVGSVIPGRGPLPGEVSLAHAGCLLLDELPEFRLDALRALGAILRHGRTYVGDGVTFPAQPQLVVATANLCPCGKLGSARPCTCDYAAVLKHRRRLEKCLDVLHGLCEADE